MAAIIGLILVIVNHQDFFYKKHEKTATQKYYYIYDQNTLIHTHKTNLHNNC